MPYFESLIPISYIRQYHFCPRIVWYKKVLRFEPPEQQWMIRGKNFHLLQSVAAKRRSTARLSGQVKRETEAYVKHSKLAIHGYVDEVNYNHSTIVVIEYKSDLRRPTTGQKLQLLAYALAASEQYGLKCESGLILKGSAHKRFEVIFDQQITQKLYHTIDAIKQTMNRHSMPDSSAQVQKCSQCEYLRYCNDR